MNKILLTLLISIGIISTSYAAAENKIKPISENKIKRMDYKLTKHKAMKRNFKTQKEFKHRQQKKMMHRNSTFTKSKNMHYNSRDYSNGYNYNRTDYRDDYRPITQRGYRHSNRGWILAYQYDRASFYDNQGYFYGYFNRYGYYFEDVFYRYDGYYTYRDRVKGRGLFDQRYYMPANAKYYGFCNTRYNDRSYERGYTRY